MSSYTKTKTSNFLSILDAYRYYSSRFLDCDDVNALVRSGEIVIGQPSTDANQRIEVDYTEGRYQIVEMVN